MKHLYGKAVARNDYASVGVLSKNFILDQNDIGNGDDDSWFMKEPSRSSSTPREREIS